MDELLPCPFCGSEPIFSSNEDGAQWVECPSCGVSSLCRFPIKEGVKRHLVEAWNQRTPPEPTPSLIAELRELANICEPPDNVTCLRAAAALTERLSLSACSSQEQK